MKLLNDRSGKPYFGSFGWKSWPTGVSLVLSVTCFPCSGTEDDTSKVVEADASVVETESSVVAVFSGSGTEDDTSKVAEAAGSVAAVSMLTSGVSVVEVLLTQMNLRIDQQRLLKDRQHDSKLALHLVFSFWTYPQDFENAWLQLAWNHFFTDLNEKKECKKLKDEK